jgi:hypothetical protein
MWTMAQLRAAQRQSLRRDPGVAGRHLGGNGRGRYTLTENSLYTAEAFGEYLDHLTDTGVLTITRGSSTASGSYLWRRRRARRAVSTRHGISRSSVTIAWRRFC